jgi:hypothetical protein
MSVSSASSLVDLIEKYHLLPLTLGLSFIGALHSLTMLLTAGFRLTSEVVDAYYDCLTKCSDSHKRYVERKCP